MRFLLVPLIAFPVTSSALEAQTELSKLASQLSPQTMRCEAQALLGDPDWIYKEGEDAELSTDPIEEWVWRNEPCAPVRVQISTETDLVTGWDEGRAFCGMEAETERRFLPDDQFIISENRTTGC